VKATTRLLAAAMVIVGVAAGCASSGTMPGAAPAHPLHSIQPGWERFFTIDWQAGTQKGHRIVSGTVQNRYGATASRVQLLVEELDDKGGVLGQHVVWLGATIGPFEAAQFGVRVEPAPNYRVSIFAYDQGRGGGP
jgi:hypothetical protein